MARCSMDAKRSEAQTQLRQLHGLMPTRRGAPRKAGRRGFCCPISGAASRTRACTTSVVSSGIGSSHSAGHPLGYWEQCGVPSDKGAIQMPRIVFIEIGRTLPLHRRDRCGDVYWQTPCVGVVGPPWARWGRRPRRWGSTRALGGHLARRQP